MGVGEALEEKKDEAKRRESENLIFKLAKKDNIPEGQVTEFVKLHKSEFDVLLPHLSVTAIKKKLSEMWEAFQKEKESESSSCDQEYGAIEVPIELEIRSNCELNLVVFDQKNSLPESPRINVFEFHMLI